jgi:hypothetical protein
VQTAGWVYTDLERLGLQNDQCALSLSFPEAMNATQGEGSNMQQFEARLAAAKNGSFNTRGQVFAIVEGKFETVIDLKDVHRQATGPGFGRAPGSTPNRLLVERILCSATIQAESTAQSQARSAGRWFGSPA